MTEDSRAPDELEVDPAADTDDEYTDDTAAENTQQAQQPTVDWESDDNPYKGRYREVQQWSTREAQRRRELEDRILAAQEQPQQAADPSDPLARERAQLEAERQRLQAEREWGEIRASTPPEILEAYGEYQRAYRLDPSPRGQINAFSAGLVALAAKVRTIEEGIAPPDKPQGAPRPAPKPRVDTSRSDAPDLDAIERQMAGAKAKGDLAGFVDGLLRRGPNVPAPPR